MRRINADLIQPRAFIASVTYADGQTFTTTIHARNPGEAENLEQYNRRAFVAGLPAATRIVVRSENRQR